MKLKILLDKILEKHKAQPVGSGYIDIIVRKSCYRNLVQELIENEFEIESISWWEWCEKGKDSIYGLGGPNSEYYNGWFAEIPVEVDDIQITNLNLQESIMLITSIIENKSIEFSTRKVEFKNADWLTPALWVKVPNEWKNKHHD